MKNLDAALEYLKASYSIIPVRRNKKPYLKSWAAYQEKQADEVLVRQWFKKWPDAGVGIVTGGTSGLDVLDIDSDEGFVKIKDLVADDLKTPMVKSPHGWHVYLKHVPGQGNATSFIEGCDYRGEGGYIIAPPSTGENGKGYAWMPGLALGEVPLAELPPALQAALKGRNCKESNPHYNNKTPYIEGGTTRNSELTTKRPQLTTTDHKLIPKGRRDDTFFHIANHLVKGRMPVEEIEYFLGLMASRCCKVPFDLKEIPIKIRSAIERARKANSNIAAEVRSWALTTNGHWLTTECHRELQLTTRDEKKACVMEILRMVERGELVKHGSKRGCYRRVEKDLEVIDWQKAESKPFNIAWPLEEELYVKLYPKNIAVYAGAKDSGKTAIALNLAQLNCRKQRIRYLSSEMGSHELRERLNKFGLSMDNWKGIEFINKSADIADAIMPNGLTIVDFLEVNEEFWKIAATLKDIYENLDNGIAVIFIQKDPGKSLGRGSTFSIEKARLYVTLDPNPPHGSIAKIKSAKNWAQIGVNPRGLARRFWIKNGAIIKPGDDWHEDYSQ